ncbi:2-keto-4-methylthiobutyrate aminotransferase [Aliidongia dinghuensis]|uniref:Probable branched-chain-amino-acid aminotransferase n=1 Tax=Aliidongia dinghuensis TaxID=1867774 RepID=A0A8J2YUX0_9PROT|nr:aminotransferase class IV [Aliidongia dinghuensis]GGF24756.1 2-keto-4-methylthiobutyrate aminotransferase [Aliidongia dinghuensis]
MTVWLNGNLVAGPAARIDPADRGFTLGDGLFETIRAEAGQAVGLDRHLARLRQGAALLGIPVAWADQAIGSAIERLLAELGLGSAAVRVTLTRGPAPRGVLPPAAPEPTLLITAGPLPGPAAPAHAVLATGTRRNEFSPLTRVKSLNFLDNVLARREAAERGADEALLLNTRGDLTEATIGNLFIEAGGQLVTPPVTDGVLPGVMRARLLEVCGAVERTIAPPDLFAADAALISNALGLRAIASVDRRPIGSAPDGSLQLVAACQAALAGR